MHSKCSKLLWKRIRSAMHRILAHRILFADKMYPLSIIEISDDGKKVKISPFTEEVEGTRFINGSVSVEKGDDGKYVVKPISTL